MEVDFSWALIAAFAVILASAAGLEVVLSAKRKREEALYLVSRVSRRTGLPLREKSLSLELPVAGGAPAVLHYHLLDGERDAITLKATRPATSRLGNLLIDSDRARVFAAGLRRLALDTPQFDDDFRIFAEPERLAVVKLLLQNEPAFLFKLRDLACRAPTSHFELVDLAGTLKVQFDDHSLRFPSDVLEVTLDLTRVFELYRTLTGASR